MMKPILAGALALATISGSLAIGTETASARDGRNGAFAAGAATGLVGGAILGGAMNRGYDEPRYGYDDPGYVARPVYSTSRCHIERRVITDDDTGDSYVKRVRVCVRPGY